MGCKCANNTEDGHKEDEEILKHDIENGNNEMLKMKIIFKKLIKIYLD
jgi:hypothetical protein